MTRLDYVLVAVAALNAVAALLAWVTKLRWSNEFREATNQMLRAKDEAIASKDAEVAALKRQAEVLDAISSGKLVSHWTNTRTGLEEVISENEQKLVELGTVVQELQEALAQQAEAVERGENVERGPSREALERELRLAVWAERRAELELQLARVKDKAAEYQSHTIYARYGDESTRSSRRIQQALFTLKAGGTAEEMTKVVRDLEYALQTQYKLINLRHAYDQAVALQQSLSIMDREEQKERGEDPDQVEAQNTVTWRTA